MQIDYDNNIKERFIPLAYDEILSGVLDNFQIRNREAYEELATLIHLYYYRLFYPDLQKLQHLYRPFNPDSDIISNEQLNSQEYSDKELQLYNLITPLLNNANYEILTEEILQETMNRTSPYGVEVSVDFDDFEHIQLFFRGESIQAEEIKDPKKLYLTTKHIEEPLYRRLFLIIKPKRLEIRAKEIAQVTGQDIEKVKRKLRRHNPLLITDEKNKNIYIKLFKNIPHMDLEMLFPNTRVKMTLFDKVKLGVIGGGGTAGGVSTLVAKLGAATLDPISALMAIGAFVGILWRQVKEVFTRRTHYMAKLSQRLYFHNLDNNEGALNYMIDMASQEESKETLLAYLFLSHQKNPLSLDELDKVIEQYVDKFYNIKIDFEVSDGLRKLRELGLLIEYGDKFTVTKLSKAIDKLREVK